MQPCSEKIVDITYVPLLPGVMDANLEVTTKELGIFLYHLYLEANNAEPETPLILERNIFMVDHETNAIDKDTTGFLTVTFEPSALGNIQSTLTLCSPTIGQYIYPLIGTCTYPTPQGPIVIQLGTSTTFTFKNPFEEEMEFQLKVQPEVFQIKSTVETVPAKKNMKIVVSTSNIKSDTVNNKPIPFTEYKGWNYELAEYLATDTGGIRHGSILINGQGVFKYLQHEAGVHRVQRIPSTEKSGRIHTSTASVLALPQPNDIEIKLDNKDLRVETKRASGAGGQHVNTTDSAVRITHLPTGVSVECQIDRSQLKNRELAMQRLRAKLYDLQLQKQEDEMLRRKKSQVKSNFRNEKIRTYNFSQDRITDHRLQNSNIHNLNYFMEGNEMLENLINKLHHKYKRDNLLNVLDEIIK
ncbi:hypothetical protein MML48_3g00010226 [Holotrichia oblita]|uniref:Uncharacterized protein n=1 Tax=Holotrichia oblita TaxID=644536 RepID=A0ACB9TFP2_HOLOL|nr:hypothetical protein MML48_3g00010226 [Holotrichia oblita]